MQHLKNNSDVLNNPENVSVHLIFSCSVQFKRYILEPHDGRHAQWQPAAPRDSADCNARAMTCNLGVAVFKCNYSMVIRVATKRPVR